MDSAKKLENMPEDTDAGYEIQKDHDELTPTPTGERRNEPDAKRRDRRVIARVSEASLRSHAGQLRTLSKIWISISAVYVVLLGALHATKGLAESTRSFLDAVVVISIAVGVYRVGRAANSFLENESVSRLSTLIERIYLLLFVICVLAGTMACVHIITLY